MHDGNLLLNASAEMPAMTTMFNQVGKESSMRTSRKFRPGAVVVAGVLIFGGIAACGSDDGDSGGSSTGSLEGVDDGTTLKMWSRAPLERQAERSEEHTSELQSRFDLVCRLLL